MDAPTPPTETVENAYEHVTEQIAALKAHKPQTQAEQRRRATELAALKQAQLNLASKVIEQNAAQQIAEVIGDDHIRKPPSHLNGNNGHAPQTNWAQVIAETELRFETRFATLKQEQSGGLTDEDLDGLARGMVPFLRETIAKAVNPLIERITELEARPSLTYEGVWSATKAYSAGTFVTHGGGLWHCEDTNVGVQPGNGSSAWKLAVKRGRAER